MDARTELYGRWRLHAGMSGIEPLAPGRKAVVAIACGVAGGLGMAVPIVIYDWASAAHSALELPMAAAAWLFGLSHFTQNGYQWWPIVIGTAFLLVFWVLLGAVFGAIADRFLGPRTLPEILGIGLAWGFFAWLLSWYTVLPIARDGAPFRATAASTLSVAPNWVFIVASAVLGLVTSLAYWAYEKA